MTSLVRVQFKSLIAFPFRPVSSHNIPCYPARVHVPVLVLVLIPGAVHSTVPLDLGETIVSGISEDKKEIMERSSLES
ncbi:MAG: hypothetical protein ACTSUE_02970 [Promethearchaeota archaeon]